MKISKTNFLICLDCAKNAWIKLHKPDIYRKYPTHLAQIADAIESIAKEKN